MLADILALTSVSFISFHLYGQHQSSLWIQNTFALGIHFPKKFLSYPQLWLQWAAVEFCFLTSGNPWDLYISYTLMVRSPRCKIKVGTPSPMLTDIYIGKLYSCPWWDSSTFQNHVSNTFNESISEHEPEWGGGRQEKALNTREREMEKHLLVKLCTHDEFELHLFRY